MIQNYKEQNPGGANDFIGLLLSLGDYFDLGQDFEKYRNILGFQSKIQYKFGSRFLVVVTKWIIPFPDLIKKFKIDRKRSKIDQKRRDTLTFSIKFDFFDLLIDFKVVFF